MRRDTVCLSEDEVDRFLYERHSMSVASLGPKGQIHLVAMWYGFNNGHVAVETYPKSQKAQNLRRNSVVTVLVEHGASYAELRGVQISGTAHVHDDPVTVQAICRSVVARYHDLESTAAKETAAAIAPKRITSEIVPQHVVSWDHRKLAS